MKTKLNLLLSGILISATCLISSCAKDGETGPAGATGAAGTNGNANVKGYLFTVNNADWTVISTANWQYNYSCSAITKSVMDSGMVMVYWDANNLPLPNTHNYVSTPFLGYQVATRTITSSWHLSSAGTGQVTVSIYDPSGAVIPAQGPLSFKVVVATAHNRMANPNLNWNNYQEVKAALNLQD